MVAAPDAAALVLLALALPISLAVTIGVFTPWLVLPGALVALAAVWRLRPASPVASPPMVWGSVAAVAGSVGWALVQLRLTGEYVTVDRDPAVYALTGIWDSAPAPTRCHPSSPTPSPVWSPSRVGWAGRLPC